MSNKSLTRSPSRVGGEKRRSEIIDALLELLDKHGPEGVTTTAIARRVGVSQGALFRHFPTKTDMWTAALEVIDGHIKPGMASIAASDAPPLERVLQVMEFWLQATRKYPAMSALIFYREPGPEGRHLRSLLAERSERLRKLILTLLVEARTRGELRTEVDPNVAAGLCLGIVQSNLLRRHLLSPCEPSETPADMFELLLEAVKL